MDIKKALGIFGGKGGNFQGVCGEYVYSSIVYSLFYLGFLYFLLFLVFRIFNVFDCGSCLVYWHIFTISSNGYG